MPKATQRGGMRTIELAFPLKGLSRRMAYQAQPPYSTPDALNVRPDSTPEMRATGGSRPCLGKAYGECLGNIKGMYGWPGEPIRLLASVTSLATDGFTHWSDEFEGDALDTFWTTAGWIGKRPTILPKAEAAMTYQGEVGVVKAAPSDIDVSKSYVIEIFIAPWAGEHHGNYRLYARMDNTAPDVTDDGVEADLYLSGTTGAYSGNLTVYVAGTPTVTAFTGGTIGACTTGWFRMLVNGNNISCYWCGKEILAPTAVHAALATETTIGFGMKCTTEDGRCLVDSFLLQYYKNVTSSETRTRLIASAGGLLYRETWKNTLELVSTDLSLASGHQLQAAEYLQKLYIADHDAPNFAGTAGSIGGGGGDELTSTTPTNPDWRTLGLNVFDYVAIIDNGAGGTVDGTYKIADIDAGGAHIHLTPAPVAGTCSFRIERAPKIYDPVANTLAQWTATPGKNVVPSGCRSIAAYQDRLFLGGSRSENPHVSQCCRKGDPLDWNYYDTDPERAWQGPASEAGNVGQPVNAIMPGSHDYIYIAGTSILKILRGDPTYGGTFDTLSHTVGVLDVKTWAHGPHSEVVFMTRDGLYVCEAGVEDTAKSISRELLPVELIDIDTNLFTVLMEYDIRFRGIQIYVTANDSRLVQHWWFDWQTKGFMPEAYVVEHEPTAIFNYVADYSGNSAVLLGCRDGYIRRHRRICESDDGKKVTSWVLLGPFRPWNEMEKGILVALDATISLGSGKVGWTVYAAPDHEAATVVAAKANGLWSIQDDSGRQRTARPRISGGSIIVKLSGAESFRRWGLEKLMATCEESGLQRR